jgi:hypothetical protein
VSWMSLPQHLPYGKGQQPFPSRVRGQQRNGRGRELALTGGSGSSFPDGKNSDPFLKGFPAPEFDRCGQHPITDVEATELGRQKRARFVWCDQCNAFHVEGRKSDLMEPEPFQS